MASLRDGIVHQRVGQVSRDVVRLLRADANPGELVWEAINYGAPRAEFGWGHAVASAVDCLSMVELYEGDQRALPIVQAIAGIAEAERGRPVNPLPPPLSRLPADPAAAFRAAVEGESVEAAQALVLGAIEAGRDCAELRRWFTAIVSDHHLSYGHAAIYTQKAFQLLERLGWDRADTVLAHLVPTIVYGTREDTLPYMRPFVRALGGARPRRPGRDRRRPDVARRRPPRGGPARRGRSHRRARAPRSTRCTTAPASTACSTRSSPPCRCACCATTWPARSTSTTTSAGSTSRTG